MRQSFFLSNYVLVLLSGNIFISAFQFSITIQTEVMKNIQDFYNHLSDNEKDLISKTLQGSYKYSKSKQLLNKLNNNDDLADSLIAKNLYNGSPKSSFSHLKSRLKKNIIEIIYNNEISEQSANSIFSDKTKCQKYLMLASMLIEKGFNDEAISYLKNSEKIINERQFTVERFMLHLLYLEVHDTPRESTAIYKSIAKDIEDLNELGKSKTLFHQLMVQGYKTTSINGEADNYLENNNALSCYYKLLTDIKTNIELFQYSSALDCSIKLISLVEKSAQRFNQSEIFKAHIIHLRTLIYNHDYKSAGLLCSHIEKSKDLRYDMETELDILKWQLYYLTKDYQKASQVYEKLSDLKNTNQSDQVIISFMELCLLYQNGQYERTIYLFLNDSQLQANNSPIPHASKLLEIFCYLELKKTDMAHSRLMAFKQYLKRNNALNRSRYQCIIKVLLRLIKSDYQYGLTLDYYKTQNSKSFNNDSQFVPDLHHYEPVNIQEWLYNKSIEIGDMHCETVII